MTKKQKTLCAVSALIVLVALAAALIFVFSGDDVQPQTETINLNGTWIVVGEYNNDVPVFADNQYMVFTGDSASVYKDDTDKPYAVCLEWHYTPGRAEQMIQYIKQTLQHTDAVEIWHVWLMDYWEFEERPVIHRKTVSIDTLTSAHIRELDDAEIWNTPDRQYPERPSFYCLTATK